MTTISSDELLEDLTHHFRILAGPGAGKTHWLILHLQNVLRHSKKIGSASKIACITYTNVAADEIKARLNESGNVVEISTIHGFLYKNILKPYIYLLTDEDNSPLVNIEKLDGHDDHRPTQDKVISLLGKANEKSRTAFLRDKNGRSGFYTYLQSMKWDFDGSCCRLTLDERKRHLFRYTPNIEYYLLIDYKKSYWKEGIIHHDDVLYFSVTILKEYPQLRQFISSRYPYIFIDEFQDTNPLQTVIIQWLAASGSLIGVIGDTAQSIYSFQGARPKDFIDFKLENQRDYLIDGNRRSTGKIINILNHVRSYDHFKIRQECLRCIDGEDVILLTGEIQDSFVRFKEICENGKLQDSDCILARKNENVEEILRNCYSATTTSDNEALKSFRFIDFNRERLFHNLLEAIELAQQHSFEKAIRTVIKSLNKAILRFKNKNDEFTELQKRGIAFEILNKILSGKDTIVSEKLILIYEGINQILSRFSDCTLAVLKEGKPKEFLETHSLIDLQCHLSTQEDTINKVRTIHMAKGAEFKSVLVFLNDEKELAAKLIKPDIINDEECRIFYVAMSRAEDLLCLSVPSISDKTKQKIEKMGIKTVIAGVGY
ncbi:MAG: UvrD-helicase domain-containing protein [Candidatus Xenobiia bacterium LiM19]